MLYIELTKDLLHILGLKPKEGASVENRDLLSMSVKWALKEAFELSNYRPVPLRPVLSTLKGGIATNWMCPEPLSTKASMPQIEKTNPQAHFETFKKVLAGCPDNLLLSKLEVYGSSLAVSDKYHDLPLYDFIKMTVGIACSLKEGNGKIRLAGAGISGIQSYLYDLVSKNAAKLLKGRSFYVQLLVDSLLEEFLDEFGLTPCHVVYSSGGGFYVFLPDKEGLEQEFQAFLKRVSESLYERHLTALFVELGMTDAFDEDKKVNEVWDELFVNLSSLKFKQLSNNSILLNDFLGRVELGGDLDKDPITNEEILKNDRRVELPDGTKVLPQTKQQIDLGKALRKAKFWVSSKNNIGGFGVTFGDPFNRKHYLEESLSKGDFSNVTVKSINDTSRGEFVFYGGNEFPTKDNGDVKAFDELVEGGGSLTRLAILRMDVDGLGGIFSEEKQIKSSAYPLNWARYSAVSRNLDHFFKGYLNELQKVVEKRIGAEDTSIIIYSGGDDLFWVGRWDTILALAEEVHLKFKEWTCNALTISGGIQLLTSKFPIMQGARMTGEAEHEAKEHKIVIEGKVIEKNSISFLGLPLNWEHEFPLVKELQESLSDLLQSKKLDQSIIGKINIHAEAQEAYLKKTMPSPKWMWNMAYDFARLGEYNKNGEAKVFIKKIQIAAVSNQYNNNKILSNYPYLKLLQLAARWAELRKRASNQDSEY